MYQRFFKRLIDIACALMGILGTSPLWLLAIIGIEVSDPGPVFYVAKRIGRKNRPFGMFKFRSMTVDRNANEKSLRPDQNRIFWWGQVMRRLKIDELPQLLNILNGTMSVIGPRPASADQVEVVRAGKYAVVSDVACGLSGPSALYDYVYGDRFENEQEYVQKCYPPDWNLTTIMSIMLALVTTAKWFGKQLFASCMHCLAKKQITFCANWKVTQQV